MKAAYKAGKLRAIGVSNFYPDRLIDICQFVDVVPAVNQVEARAMQQQQKAPERMEKYGKSSAQISLRFLIQSDVIVIPKTVRKERMIENINVFDFTLTDEDMKAIRALDEETSAFFSHYDPGTVEFLTGLGK